MPLVTRTGQVSFAPKGDKGDKGARMRMRVWGAIKVQLCATSQYFIFPEATFCLGVSVETDV